MVQLFVFVLSVILTFLTAMLRGWFLTLMWTWFVTKFFPTIPTLPLISAIGFFLFLNLLGRSSIPQKYPAQTWWDYLREIGQSLIMHTGVPFFLAWVARYAINCFHLIWGQNKKPGKILPGFFVPINKTARLLPGDFILSKFCILLSTFYFLLSSPPVQSQPELSGR